MGVAIFWEWIYNLIIAENVTGNSTGNSTNNTTGNVFKNNIFILGGRIL